MIAIDMFRNQPETVKQSERKRGNDIARVDRVVELDQEWRQTVQELNELRAKRNEVDKKIAELKREGKDAEEQIKEMKEVSKRISQLEEEEKRLKQERDNLRLRIGNVLQEEVPKGQDEADNVEFKRWGQEYKPDVDYEIKSHVDLLQELGLGDIKRAAKVSGSRFFYLRQELVELDLALIRFALDELIAKGFTPVEPPFMMRRDPYEGVTDLDDFGDVIYKVEDEDLYLIATAEHPLAAMHQDEILEADELPKKFAGVSPCFRKEAGAHGKDTKGIFRTHQFNKVEQFVFSRPETSWDLFEKLQQNAEDIYQQLQLPYRVVNICTGDIGKVAAKKYDIEAWFPSQESYREVTSCSNCTDYQARRLNIRWRQNPGDETEYVHTVNNTALATGRTMVAILENYQQQDGTVIVPEVLRPYINGKEKIGDN